MDEQTDRREQKGGGQKLGGAEEPELRKQGLKQSESYSFSEN
jgi:hypothetical protein